MTPGGKIILPGGAGLVGQNLAARLDAQGGCNIVVLDKHRANLEILRRTQPRITAEYADLAEPGGWQRHFAGASGVVMLQAQIGGHDWRDFARNNLAATRHVLDAMTAQAVPPYLVHVSSSAVNSAARDFYADSKRAQEDMVAQSGLRCAILRPTLMFGWFDRKHLGWLARFMRSVPVFPVPGNGRYPRQPLYAGDFCAIIRRCLERRQTGAYNISGPEKIDYIDMIREIRHATKARAAIVKIPYGLFHGLLALWGLFDRNPPFTTRQLAALVARDEFEVIDWPGIFGVPATPFARAIHETFNDPVHGKVVLEF